MVYRNGRGAGQKVGGGINRRRKKGAARGARLARTPMWHHTRRGAAKPVKRRGYRPGPPTAPKQGLVLAGSIFCLERGGIARPTRTRASWQ